jgi:hypothetical protein
MPDTQLQEYTTSGKLSNLVVGFHESGRGKTPENLDTLWLLSAPRVSSIACAPVAVFGFISPLWFTLPRDVNNNGHKGALPFCTNCVIDIPLTTTCRNTSVMCILLALSLGHSQLSFVHDLKLEGVSVAKRSGLKERETKQGEHESTNTKDSASQAKHVDLLMNTNASRDAVLHAEDATHGHPNTAYY